MSGADMRSSPFAGLACLVLLLVAGARAEGDGPFASVAELVAGTADASTLASALAAAGLPDLGPLSDGGWEGTVFVPTDDAFKQAIKDLGLKGVAALLKDGELLGSVLPYHVVPGSPLAAADLEDGALLQSLLGGQEGQLQVSVSKGKPRLRTTSGQKAKVVAGDLRAGGAVVHFVDKVLIPGTAYFEAAPPPDAADPALPAPLPAPQTEAPPDAEAPTPAPTPAPAPSEPSPPPAASPPPAPAPSPPPRPPLPASLCQHTVAAGEFLSSIAGDYGLTNDALLALNPSITNPGSIPLGAVLNVPCKKA